MSAHQTANQKQMRVIKMKTLILNISNSELLSFIRKNYLIVNFTKNLQILKIESINGISELSEVVTRFKKFDKLSIQEQVKFLAL